MLKLSNSANLMYGQPMFRALAKVKELEKQGKTIYHLEIGEPYFNAPPEVIEATCKSLRDNKTHYTNSMGTYELREAISKYAFNALLFLPHVENIVVLPAHSIIYFSIACLVNKNDEVIYPDPGFPSYLASINLVGAKPVPVQLKEENNFRMQPEDVEKLITPKTKLIIMNSPSNPTGAVMNNVEVFEVAELARRHNIFLLSDETYAKVIYEGLHWSPARLVDRCYERTIILNSFSKCFSMTGFRLGYAIAPKNIAEKLGLMVQTTISCVPQFIQDAGIVALEKCDYYNNMIVSKLKIQRDWIVNELKSIGLPCHKPDGAFYLMPNISGTKMSSDKFTKVMLDNGVALLSGTDFGKYGEGFVRISYASEPNNLMGAINRMKEVLG